MLALLLGWPVAVSSVVFGCLGFSLFFLFMRGLHVRGHGGRMPRVIRAISDYDHAEGRC
jgi:hypothetical protein